MKTSGVDVIVRFPAFLIKHIEDSGSNQSRCSVQDSIEFVCKELVKRTPIHMIEEELDYRENQRNGLK